MGLHRYVWEIYTNDKVEVQRVIDITQCNTIMIDAYKLIRLNWVKYREVLADKENNGIIRMDKLTGSQ